MPLTPWQCYTAKCDCDLGSAVTVVIIISLLYHVAPAVWQLQHSMRYSSSGFITLGELQAGRYILLGDAVYLEMHSEMCLAGSITRTYQVGRSQ